MPELKTAGLIGGGDQAGAGGSLPAGVHVQHSKEGSEAEVPGALIFRTDILLKL